MNIEVLPLQRYSLPYKELPSDRPAGKGQIAELPNFTSHCYYPDKQALFTGQANGNILMFYRKSDKPNTKRTTTPDMTLSGHKGGVTFLMYHPTHKLLCSASVDASIKIWDPFPLKPASSGSGGSGVGGAGSSGSSGSSFSSSSRKSGSGLGDGESGEQFCLQTITGHGNTVTALAWYSDLLISGSVDGTVKIWKNDEGRGSLLHPWFVCMQELKGFEGWIGSIAASPILRNGDAPDLIIGDHGGNLSMYKAIERFEPNRPPQHQQQQLHHDLSSQASFRDSESGPASSGVRSVKSVLQSAGSALRVSSAGSSSSSSAPQRSSPSFLLAPPSGASGAATPSSSRHSVASAGGAGGLARTGTMGLLKSKSIKNPNSMSSISLGGSKDQGGGATLRKSVTFELFKRLRSYHGMSVSRLMYATDENLIISISFDNTLRLCDAKSCSQVGIMENSRKCRYIAFDWNSNEEEIWALDEQGYLDVYKFAAQRIIFSTKLREHGTWLTLMGKSGGAISLVVSHRFDVELWRISRSVPFKELEAHEGPLFGLSLVASPGDPTDRRLVSVAQDNRIMMWAIHESDLQYLRQKKEQDDITCFTFSVREGLVITGHEDGTIKLWQIDTGKMWTLKGHTNSVAALAVCSAFEGNSSSSEVYDESQQPHLISGGYDNALGVWDMRRGPQTVPTRMALIQDAHDAEILCAAYDPARGGTYLTGSNDCTIRIWTSKKPELIRILRGHTEAVTTLILDANFVFSGSEDRTIRMWNSQSGDQLRCFTSVHEREITSLSLSLPLGHIISSSLDGTVVVFSYTTGQRIKQFESPAECWSLVAERDGSEIFVGTEHGSLLRFSNDGVATAGLEPIVMLDGDGEELPIYRDQKEEIALAAEPVEISNDVAALQISS